MAAKITAQDISVESVHSLSICKRKLKSGGLVARSAVIAAGGMLATVPTLRAASATWSAAPTSSDWTNVANWVSSVPGSTAPSGNAPRNNDIATFNTPIFSGIGGTSNPIAYDNTRFIKGITFDTGAGAYVIGVNSGNLLFLDNAGVIQVNAGVTNAQVIAGPIQVRQASSTNGTYTFLNNSTTPGATLSFTNPTFTLTNANGRPTTLTLDGSNTGTNIISSNITNATAAQGVNEITKQGTGTWILSGANSFTSTSTAGGAEVVANGVQINGGTLIAENNLALGTIPRGTTTTGKTSINSGGTLELANNPTSGAVTLDNGVFITLNGGGTLLSNGSQFVNSTVSISTTASASETISTVNAADVFTIGNAANDLTGGSATSVIHVSGPGTVVQAFASNYAGGWSVDSGTLSLGAATALGSATTAAVAFGPGSTGKLQLNNNSVTVVSLNTDAITPGSAIIENGGATPSTLTLTAAASTANVYAGILRDGTGGGSLGLIKMGAGSLQLTGASSYSGGTTINSGILLANNTSGSATGTGAVNVNSPAIFGGTGTAAGLVTVASGGHLSPGSGGIGTLSVGSLTLNPGAQLDYDIASTASLDQTNVTGTNGLTINGGQLNINGGTSGFTANGVYNLIQFAGAIGGAGPGSLSLNPSNAILATNTYSFGASGGFVTLTVGTNSGGAVSFWNADADGNWNPGSWVDQSGNPVATPNAAGVFASFGGGGTTITAPRTITVNGAFTVGTLNFNNPTQSYTLAAGSGANITLDNGSAGAFVTDAAGNHTIQSPLTLTSLGATFSVTAASDTLTVSGGISGGGGLSKSGSGTLVLATANTYTGNTSLNSGTLQVGDSQALSSGSLGFVGSGTLRAGASGLALSNNVNLGAFVNATVDTQAFTSTLSGVISSTDSSSTLIKAGTGTLILTGANTATSATTINAGVLQVGNGVTNGILPTGPVVDNGSLVFSPPTATPVTVANNVSGSGNIVSNGDSTSPLTLGGANTQAGGLAINNGGTVVLTSPLTGTTINQAAAGGGTIAIHNNGTLAMNGGSGAVSGSISDDGTLSDPIVIDNGGTATLQLAARGTFNGTMSGGTAGSPSTLNLDVNFVRDKILGDWTGLTGTVNVVNDSPTSVGVMLEVNGVWNAPNAKFVMQPNVNIIQLVTSATATFGDLTTPTTTGDPSIVLGGTGVAANLATFAIGNAEQAGVVSTFAGIIRNQTREVSITKQGLGILDFSLAPVFSGSINVQSGTLTYAGALAADIGEGAGPTVGTSTHLGIAMGTATTGGTLDMAGYNFTVGTTSTIATIGLSTAAGSPGPNIIGSAGNSSPTQNGNYPNVAFTVAGGTGTFAGTLVDTLSIPGIGSSVGTNTMMNVVVTGGTTTITGTEAYTGGTRITGGTWLTGSSGALGFGGAITPNHPNPVGTTVGTGTQSRTGGILDLDGQVINEPITLSGGSLINSSTTVAATLGSGIKGFGFNGGQGFSAAPAISISAPAGGTAATATAAVDSSGNVNITMTSAGSGYSPSAPPTITFTGGSGSISTASILVSSLALTTDSYIGGAGSINVLPAITGNGGLTKLGAGTTSVAANNSYNGTNVLTGGIFSGAKIGAGGSPSSLGSSSSASSNLQLMGGTLQYTGTGDTTDRQFSVYPTGGGLDASGSGPITFSSTSPVSVLDAPSETATEVGTTTVTLTQNPVAFDLVAGMTVTGTNIAAGTTIATVATATGTITLSTAATAGVAATPANDTLSFGSVASTFTLTGTNTGNNTLAAPLTNTPGGGKLSLSKTGAGTWLLSGISTYTGNTTVSAGTLALASAGKIASPTLSVAAGATANVNGLLTGTPAVTANGLIALGANDGVNGTAGQILARNWGTLSVGTGGNVSVTATTAANHAQRTLLVLNSASANPLTNIGLIDLSNNDLVVQHGDTGSVTTVGSIANQLKSGFNAGGGYWNGTTGIISTTAAHDSRFLTTLGYRTGGSNFDGLGTSAIDVLVKYTYYGDADLNGTVDGADYQQIDNGFGSGATGWQNGDFNYDGVINGSDFALIDNTFNQLTATGASALALVGSSDVVAIPTAVIGTPAVTAVPEPTTLGLIGIGAIGLLGRRKRRSVHMMTKE